MDLKYKRIGHYGENVNKQANINLSKKFAIDVLKILKFGMCLINFDESINQGTCSKSYSWERKGQFQSRVIRRNLSGISMLLAILSDGIRIFQFMDGINNQDSV